MKVNIHGHGDEIDRLEFVNDECPCCYSQTEIDYADYTLVKQPKQVMYKYLKSLK